MLAYITTFWKWTLKNYFLTKSIKTSYFSINQWANSWIWRWVVRKFIFAFGSTYYIKQYEGNVSYFKVLKKYRYVTYLEGIYIYILTSNIWNIAKYMQEAKVAWVLKISVMEFMGKSHILYSIASESIGY